MAILGVVTARIIGGLKITADAAAKIGMRLGMQSIPSVGQVIAAARANPLTAGLIIAEVYGVASQEYNDYLAENENLREQLELFNFKVDEITEFNAANPDVMAEEFGVITRAARQVGGFNELLALKQALALSNDHYALYAKVSNLGRGLVKV